MQLEYYKAILKVKILDRYLGCVVGMSDDTFKGDILGGVSGVALNISRGNSNRLFEGNKLGTVNTIGLVLELVVSRFDLLVRIGGNFGDETEGNSCWYMRGHVV